MKADILSKQLSPSIARYKEHGKTRKGDVYWIIMELLRGTPLDQFCDENKALPETEVIEVRLSIVLGLNPWSKTNLAINHRLE